MRCVPFLTRAFCDTRRSARELNPRARPPCGIGAAIAGRYFGTPTIAVLLQLLESEGGKKGTTALQRVRHNSPRG